MAQKVLKAYYTIVFLEGLSVSFFFATYVLFLQEAGLNLLEVNLINCIFMISCFVLEFPTGMLADNVSRKYSVVLSFFMHALAMLIYFLSKSFFLFALAEVVAALGSTLHSGAFTAWFVDAVKHYESKFDLGKAFRKAFALTQSGRLIGVVVGAYAGQIDLVWPWLFSCVGFTIVGFISIFSMREDGFVKPKERIGVGLAIQESIKCGIKNKAVFFIFIVGFVFCMSVAPLNMYWQPIFKEYGVSTFSLGFIFDGLLISLIIGSIGVKLVSEYFSSEKKEMIFILILLSICIIVSATAANFWLVLISFFAHEVARGGMDPLRSQYINEKISSEKRAIILSFDSMNLKLGMFLGLVLSGLIADAYGPRVSWLAAGVLLLLAIPFLLTIKNGD